MCDLSQFLLQISQITCLQMENFVVAILYLVYFALKYMYFEDLWVKSRKNEVTNHLLSSFWKIQEHSGALCDGSS